MTEQKQIEEMAKVMCGKSKPCSLCEVQAPCRCQTDAELLNAEGYRKQIVGEWHIVVDNKNDIVTECTACKKQFWFMKKGQLNIDRMPYCPNCGARMKGDSNG